MISGLRQVALFLIASVAMSSFTFGIGRYGYGLFLPSIREEYGLSTSQLALVASVSGLVYLLSNLLTSACAVHFRPKFLIILSGLATILGIGAAALATDFLGTAAGIIFAGIGAGIFAPAIFEAIDAFLDERAKTRAVGVLTAGATPGIVLTGLAAFTYPDVWKSALLFLAGLGVVATILNGLVMPAGQTAAKNEPELFLKLSWRLFFRPECLPLYATTFVYGILMISYLTFSVDLITNTGGVSYPYDRLFWVLLGLAGMPAMLSGLLIERMGIARFLLTTLPLLGLSLLLLGVAPKNVNLIFASAVVFGFASIAPGGALFVWAINLFPRRASVGSGVVLFLISIAMIVGPLMVGFAETFVSMPVLFIGLAACSVLLLFILPYRRTSGAQDRPSEQI